MAVAKRPPAGIRVPVHLKHAPVRAAIAGIMAQMHLPYRINIIGGPSYASELIGPKTSVSTVAKSVTMNLTHAPFWVAMRELAAQADISLWNPADSISHGLVFTDQNVLIGPKTPISIHGRYMTELFRMGLSRNIDYTDRRPAIQQSFTLSFIFAVTPNFAILKVLPNQPHITRATDNRGNPLVYVDSPFGSQDSFPCTPVSRWWAWLWLPLRRPDHPGGRIRQLAGTITALVASKLQAFRYSVVSGHPQAFKIMGVVLTIKRVKKVGRNYCVVYTVKVRSLVAISRVQAQS